MFISYINLLVQRNGRALVYFHALLNLEVSKILIDFPLSKGAVFSRTCYFTN